MIRQLALCNQNQGQNYCEKETTEEAIQGIVLNTLGQAKVNLKRFSVPIAGKALYIGKLSLPADVIQFS